MSGLRKSGLERKRKMKGWRLAEVGEQLREGRRRYIADRSRWLGFV